MKATAAAGREAGPSGDRSRSQQSYAFKTQHRSRIAEPRHQRHTTQVCSQAACQITTVHKRRPSNEPSDESVRGSATERLREHELCRVVLPLLVVTAGTGPSAERDLNERNARGLRVGFARDPGDCKHERCECGSPRHRILESVGKFFAARSSVLANAH